MKKMIEVPSVTPVSDKSETDRVFETEPTAKVAVKVPGGYVVFDDATEAQAFAKNPIIPADIVRVPAVAEVVK